MASVSQLKAELKALENQLKTMKKRLDEVKKVESGLEKKLDSQIAIVNGHINSCKEKIESGLGGFRVLETLPYDITDKKEGIDVAMSEMLSYLRQEISRCQGEKMDLETKIQRKKSEIEEAKRKEREAKKLW